MHEPLTAAEYKAIAAYIQFPTNAFIDGAFRPANSGKTFKTTNPATGDTLAEIAACDASDVDFAVAKAREAFDDGRWHLRSPGERKAVLLKFAKLLEDNRHELAVMESLDSGKPVRECQTVDIPDTIHTIRWHAELIDKLYDNVAPVGSNALTMVVREPVGVVGCVLPWNFPLLMLAWKIGPALAAGCSVIVKPAQETTLTTLRVAELAHEAGIPAGVFNVVTGGGKEVGEPIGTHMDVDMVAFTGSTPTGRRFLHYAADSNLKRVVLECGGKNPAVVLEDAEDLDLVAEQVVNGAFWNMGENCSATSRLIVHAKIKDELAAADRRLSCASGRRATRSTQKIASARSSARAHFEKVKSFLGRREDRKALGRPWRRHAQGHLHRADRRRRRHAFEPPLSGGDLRTDPFGHDVHFACRGRRSRQRHELRADRVRLHRQPHARRSSCRAKSGPAS
jgi:gamma-glutamyl-gamma-aminobutyraldehyde dehydrogenase